MRKKQCIVIGLMVSVFFNLTGCATAPKGVSVKKIFNHCQMPEWMKQQLSATSVINVGQTMILVLPADKLFLPNTANMLPGAKSLLEAVACVLKSYDKVMVNIEGYTNYSPWWKYNQALSRLQASKVANVLRREKINSRLISAMGMGTANPIMPPGSSENRRIVVRFKYLNAGK